MTILARWRRLGPAPVPCLTEHRACGGGGVVDVDLVGQAELLRTRIYRRNVACDADHAIERMDPTRRHATAGRLFARGAPVKTNAIKLPLLTYHHHLQRQRQRRLVVDNHLLLLGDHSRLDNHLLQHKYTFHHRKCSEMQRHYKLPKIK